MWNLLDESGSMYVEAGRGVWAATCRITKDDRNNIYRLWCPQMWKKTTEKNHKNLEKNNLRRQIFQKHWCQNTNLELFSWWSPKGNNIYTSPERDQQFFCVFKALRTGCSCNQDPTFVISKYNPLICHFSFVSNYIKD